MADQPQSAVRRLLGRGSIYTLCFGVQLSAGLIVTPILTRLLPTSSFGRIATCLVVISCLQVLATGGLAEVAGRAWFRSDEGPDHARSLAVTCIPVAVLVGIVFDATGPLWAGALSLHYDAALRLAVWTGCAGGVLLGAQALLRAADRAWVFLGITAIASAGAQGIGLGLTIAYRTPAAYVAGLGVGTIVAAVLALHLARALRRTPSSLREIRAALGIGLPMLPYNLAVYSLAASDRLVVAALLGLPAAARYQVAYAVGGLGVTLITALNQAWLPLFLGASDLERWTVLAKTSVAVHRIAIGIAGALALLAPIGLAFAAPASYDRSSLVPVSAVIAASALPYATCSAYFHGLFFEASTRVMAISAPIAAGVNIAMDIVLLKTWGLMAAAVATVVAYAVFAIAGIWGSRGRPGRSGLLSSSALSWLAAVPAVVFGAVLPDDGEGIVIRIVLALLLLLAVIRPALSLRGGPEPEVTSP
jgi:O-antigen/teichoic acid export membrane protein